MEQKCYPQKGDYGKPSFYARQEIISFWVMKGKRRIGSISFMRHHTYNENPDIWPPRCHGAIFTISFAVIPRYQHGGIGGIMMAWLIAYARTHGFMKIYSTIRVSNMASIALHKKFGFTVKSLISQCYTDAENGFVLELALPPKAGCSS
ncbi:MAG: Ribosomal-protein-alanine N-acetyltransferase [Parcubacteria group bacterium GW2011_GWA2_47_7]|nr:MAG: Ribosomal-protein-alanine N-acetyltransferase [Parcubacteria group bacterium GW2011_GWA2_47_7]